jgi:hypothetical protein
MKKENPLYLSDSMKKENPLSPEIMELIKNKFGKYKFNSSDDKQLMWFYLEDEISSFLYYNDYIKIFSWKYKNYQKDYFLRMIKLLAFE